MYAYTCTVYAHMHLIIIPCYTYTFNACNALAVLSTQVKQVTGQQTTVKAIIL